MGTPRGRGAFRWLPVAVTCVVVSLVASLIIFSRESPDKVMDLNNSGVWVTNDSRALFGRINRSAGSLDAALADPKKDPGAVGLDILQDGEAIVAWTRTQSRLFAIDTTTSVADADNAVPVSAKSAVAMGGGVLAVIDADTGEVRTTRYSPAANITDLSPLAPGHAAVTKIDPGTNGPGQVAITVDTDGRVFAASTSGKTVTITPSGKVEPGELQGSHQALGQVSVSLVHGVPVVTDPTTSAVYVNGQAGQAGPGVVPQQPSVTGDKIILASATALFTVGLSGGEPDQIYSIPQDPGSAPAGQTRVPAQPVVTAGAIYGAWGGTPGRVVRIADGATVLSQAPANGSKLVTPVFRVNRGSVLLNDMNTGLVYDVDEQKILDNWTAIEPPRTNKTTQTTAGQAPQDLQVEPDHLWVRPGVTSVLHVLDNDKNPGAGIVAITGLSGPDSNSVAVSPDGQTLVVTAPDGQKDDMIVTYSAANQADGDAPELRGSATVTISMRGPGSNTPPTLFGPLGRDAGKPDYTVPSGGTLSVAPAYMWRDDDSDPLAVVAAAAGERALPVTAGLIRYTAPATVTGQVDEVTYQVTDGYGEPVPGKIYVQVLASNALTGVAPGANPDVARGVVGQPIRIYPLDNDVPGCDTMTKKAVLELVAPVGGRPDLSVTTDLATGAVTAVADRPGVFFLDYTAGYGSQMATGKIRVDAVAADPVVAMPDTAVVRGTVPATVDVLFNDHDGQGSVLTVVSATPRDPGAVQAGVVAGRWLRVSMTGSGAGAAPQIVDYVVTNGAGGQAAGQLAITQEAPLDFDAISVNDDYAQVRAGDATSIPVLANDFSQSGAPLAINDNVDGLPAGQLPVEDPSAPLDGATDNVGQAYVDGTRIRYTAPAAADETRLLRITYQASSPTGSPATGYVWVTVVPEPVPATDEAGQPVPGQLAGNQPPNPAPVDARAMSGETISIPVDVYGQDPDGDSVTVTGLASPPRYGRVTGFTGDSLAYESYPDVTNPGTDSLQFYVQDRYGATGTGTVRIGLSPPATPAPPIAVDDLVTAKPGAAVTVYPKTNDLIPVGISPQYASVVLDGDPAGVSLDPATNALAAVAPPADDPAVTAGYHLDAMGIAGVPAQVSVRSQEGYLNPPRVSDHIAGKIASGVASVDVLDNAWDVDGPAGDIHIKWVGAGATFEGNTVSVPVTDRGQIVPFVVEDADSAQAMAVVFVPGYSATRPALVTNGVIKMDQNGTATVSLGDYITSPRGKPVFITLASRVWTSPQMGLSFTVASNQQVILSATNDYIGPAALSLEVRDSAAADDPQALAGVVTIPVQIGPDQPVLHCPGDVQPVVAGGNPRELDITQYCHVWTRTPGQYLAYTAAWVSGGDDLELGGAGGSPLPSPVVSMRAAPQAVPGARSEVLITVDGFPLATGRIPVVVTAGKPVLQVPNLTDVRQGTTATAAATVTSQLDGAVQHIVSVTQTSGPAATVSFDDQAIRVTPDPGSHGVLSFDVVGSDVMDDARTDRQVMTSFSVTVYGIPDAPTAPQPGTSLRSGSAVVTFAPGSDNGSPITGYEVQWAGGSQSCGLNTTCEIKGLTNGVAYAFQARATNKAGSSPWSGVGPAVVPDAVLGGVTGFAGGTPVCGGVTLTWTGVTGDGSAPTSYRVTWGGRFADVPGGAARSYAVTGLDDNTIYTFSIVAVNQAGTGQPATTKAQSSCQPLWPADGEVRVVPEDAGDSAKVKVSWPAADPRGPKPVTYTVTRTGGSAPKEFAATTGTSVDDSVSYDGTRYTYSVSAQNGTTGKAHASVVLSKDWKAVGSPAAWSTVKGAKALSVTATGTDGQLEVSVLSWPEARDADSSLYVVVRNGNTEIARLDKAHSSKPVEGFEDGKDVELGFTAHNSSGAGNAAQQVPLSGGSYGPLGKPSLTAVKGTGTQACVRATTPTAGDSKDTNGRAATLVITAAEFGKTKEFPASGPVNGPIDSGTWCVDTGGYNTTAHFVAHLKPVPLQKRDFSLPAEIDSTSPYGVPGAMSNANVSCRPTGTDGQATCTASHFPAANAGGSERTTLKVKGPGGTTTVTDDPWTGTLTGFTNGNLTDVTFTPCNSVQCNDVGAGTAQVTTYGPMTLEKYSGQMIVGGGGSNPTPPTQTVTTTEVCAGFRANANGAGATLGMESDHGGSDIKSGSGMLYVHLCVDAGGYDTEVTFFARLEDNSFDRGMQTLDWTKKSQTKAPTVQVTRNTSVSKTQCKSDPAHACFPIEVTLADFQGDAVCTFTLSDGTDFTFTEANGTHSSDGNSYLQHPDPVYDGGAWRLECHENARNMWGVSEGTWPIVPYP